MNILTWLLLPKLAIFCISSCHTLRRAVLYLSVLLLCNQDWRGQNHGDGKKSLLHFFCLFENWSLFLHCYIFTSFFVSTILFTQEADPCKSPASRWILGHICCPGHSCLHMYKPPGFPSQWKRLCCPPSDWWVTVAWPLRKDTLVNTHLLLM